MSGNDVPRPSREVSAEIEEIGLVSYAQKYAAKQIPLLNVINDLYGTKLGDLQGDNINIEQMRYLIFLLKAEKTKILAAEADFEFVKTAENIADSILSVCIRVMDGDELQEMRALIKAIKVKYLKKEEERHAAAIESDREIIIKLIAQLKAVLKEPANIDTILTAKDTKSPFYMPASNSQFDADPTKNRILELLKKVFIDFVKYAKGTLKENTNDTNNFNSDKKFLEAMVSTLEQLLEKPENINTLLGSELDKTKPWVIQNSDGSQFDRTTITNHLLSLLEKVAPDFVQEAKAKAEQFALDQLLADRNELIKASPVPINGIKDGKIEDFAAFLNTLNAINVLQVEENERATSALIAALLGGKTPDKVELKLMGLGSANIIEIIKSISANKKLAEAIQFLHLGCDARGVIKQLLEDKQLNFEAFSNLKGVKFEDDLVQRPVDIGLKDSVNVRWGWLPSEEGIMAGNPNVTDTKLEQSTWLDDISGAETGSIQEKGKVSANKVAIEYRWEYSEDNGMFFVIVNQPGRVDEINRILSAIRKRVETREEANIKEENVVKAQGNNHAHIRFQPKDKTDLLTVKKIIDAYLKENPDALKKVDVDDEHKFAEFAKKAEDASAAAKKAATNPGGLAAADVAARNAQVGAIHDSDESEMDEGYDSSVINSDEDDLGSAKESVAPATEDPIRTVEQAPVDNASTATQIAQASSGVPVGIGQVQSPNTGDPNTASTLRAERGPDVPPNVRSQLVSPPRKSVHATTATATLRQAQQRQNSQRVASTDINPRLQSASLPEMGDTDLAPPARGPQSRLTRALTNFGRRARAYFAYPTPDSCIEFAETYINSLSGGYPAKLQAIKNMPENPTDDLSVPDNFRLKLLDAKYSALFKLIEEIESNNIQPKAQKELLTDKESQQFIYLWKYIRRATLNHKIDWLNNIRLFANQGGQYSQRNGDTTFLPADQETLQKVKRDYNELIESLAAMNLDRDLAEIIEYLKGDYDQEQHRDMKSKIAKLTDNTDTLLKNALNKAFAAKLALHNLEQRLGMNPVAAIGTSSQSVIGQGSTQTNTASPGVNVAIGGRSSAQTTNRGPQQQPQQSQQTGQTGQTGQPRYGTAPFADTTTHRTQLHQGQIDIDKALNYVKNVYQQYANHVQHREQGHNLIFSMSVQPQTNPEDILTIPKDDPRNVNAHDAKAAAWLGIFALAESLGEHEFTFSLVTNPPGDLNRRADDFVTALMAVEETQSDNYKFNLDSGTVNAILPALARLKQMPSLNTDRYNHVLRLSGLAEPSTSAPSPRSP